MKCPKCEYERTKQDDELHPKTECPKCGVIYSRVNIKQVKEETAQKKVLEKEKEEGAFEDGQRKRIQQMSTGINKLPSEQRFEAILVMTPWERGVFLEAESTVEALNGKSLLQRNKYLYGGLWKTYRLFMNSGFMQKAMIGFLLFMGVFVIGIWISETDFSSSKSNHATVSNSDWDGSVSQVKSWIKSNVKDPSSLEFINWSPVQKNASDSYYVRVKYRAKNSFGGFVIEEKVFFMDKAGSIIRMVNY